MNEQKVEEIKIEESKLEPFTEFETKYLTNLGMLDKFKKIAESLPDLLSFSYVEGPDYFYENDHLPDMFMRFRRSSYPNEKGEYFQQLTTKTKTPGAKNSRKRKEPNLMVPGSVEEINSFIKSINFTFTHGIKKQCHIYACPDATLVFYAVKTDSMSEPDYYVETEVDEATIHNLTETEALAVIEKYEKIFSSIEGVSAKKRLKLSLRDRYMR